MDEASVGQANANESFQNCERRGRRGACTNEQISSEKLHEMLENLKINEKKDNEKNNQEKEQET